MTTDTFQDHIRQTDDRRSYFDGHRIISDQMDQARLQVVRDQLETVLQQNISGHIVELGCYAGTTSLFIRRQLDAHQQSSARQFHVYDSFAGLPPKLDADNSTAGEAFQAGALQVSKAELLKQFKAAALSPPTVHKGWFADLTQDDIPMPIAFAFLDGDFYSSIIDSLRLVWPQLSPGGVVLIDDYHNVHLPGVDRAIHDYFQAKRITIHEQHNIAVIKA